MKKIGIVSDTHGHIDDKLFEFFKDVDEIWHAGDWGSYDVVEKLTAFKPVRGVFGNIDGYDIRSVFPEINKFQIEQVQVWLTHICGYPGKYHKKIKSLLYENPPDLLVCGHSHILKIIFDQKLNLLHINPGAYGFSGFHKKRTAVKLEIDGKEFKNLKILELDKKSKII